MKKAKRTIIEDQKPLSQSMIWQMQRNFYAEHGKSAWEYKVPYFVTSNACIAKVYAHAILGYLQDCERHTIDRAQPIHIVELGTGSGRFSYLLIKKLQAIRLQLSLPKPVIRYVMTDFIQKNIDFWRGNPALQPFIKDGLLDFALFDAENDSRLLLQESGIVLAPETNHNPVIVLANYLFDSLTQDIFRVQTGKLKEGLVTLFTKESTLPGPQKPLKLDHIKVLYKFKQVPNGYYQDPEFNTILHNYRDRLSFSTFCFPIGALRCIRNLLHLSHNRLFLLSTDKGRCREQDLLGKISPLLITHDGCFSLPVNYHAIGRYFQNKKGNLCLHKKSRDGQLCISGFVSGEASQSYISTQLAWAEHIETFGPGEFFDLFKVVYEEREMTPLPILLSMIRLSDYDSKVFYWLSSAILIALDDNNSYEHDAELFQILDRVWDNWYPMQESWLDANQMRKIYRKRQYYDKCILINQSMKQFFDE